MKQKRRIAALLAAVFCAAALSGCGFKTPGVDDLLRAPQLDGAYAAVQTALNNSLETTPQLKYPASGSFRSPFLFGDWDGDGTEDAAVLYANGAGANVNIAWLYLDEAGSWKVNSTAEGLATAVESAVVTDLGGGKKQLLVGFSASGGGHYLQLYSTDSQREPLLQAQLQYSRYLREDITGDDREDLIVLTEGETDHMDLYLLTMAGEAVTQQRLLSSDDALMPFSACLSLQSEIGSDRRRYLLLDATLSSNGALCTNILRYDRTSGLFHEASFSGVEDLTAETTRHVTNLISRDIDGNGILEVPVPYGAAGTTAFSEESRYAYVAWMDYTNYRPMRQYGICSGDHNFYLQLPEEWQGRLVMSDGGEKGSLLVSLRAVAEPQPEPPEQTEPPEPESEADEPAEAPEEASSEPTEEPGGTEEPPAAQPTPLFEVTVGSSAQGLLLDTIDGVQIRVRILDEAVTWTDIRQWYMAL